MLQLHEVVVVVVVVGEDGGDFCISCNHDETVLHVMECFQGKIASKCPGTGEMMLVWRSGPTHVSRAVEGVKGSWQQAPHHDTTEKRR